MSGSRILSGFYRFLSGFYFSSNVCTVGSEHRLARRHLGNDPGACDGVRAACRGQQKHRSQSFGVALVSAVRLLSRGSGARRSGLACVHPAELDIGCSVRLGPAVVGRSPVVPVSSFSDRTTVHNQIGTILCQWQQVLGKGEEWLIITLLLLSQIYISALAMNRRRLR